MWRSYWGKNGVNSTPIYALLVVFLICQKSPAALVTRGCKAFFTNTPAQLACGMFSVLGFELFIAGHQRGYKVFEERISSAFLLPKGESLQRLSNV